MAAPHIPNLNTLRRGANGRGRGRGRGGLRNVGDPETSMRANDKVVQETDNDASVSRRSAVELGYLHDPYAKLFTSDADVRRYPIINRGEEKLSPLTRNILTSPGTYVRTTAIDTLITRFLGTGKTKKQIISLGAGSDTRVFRLLSRHSDCELVYHELDFPANTSTKIAKILSSPSLLQALRIPTRDQISVSENNDALHSKHFHIHPVDLRSLSAGGPLQAVDTTLPTLLISECCLIYLSPVEAINVISYFTNTLFPPSTGDHDENDGNDKQTKTEMTTPLALIIYEPFRPDDPFGRTMVANLAARGIKLQTLHRYGTPDAQRNRLREHGFLGGQRVADVDFIWENWVSQDEKDRVAGLEMLDEIEEWALLAKHYCVAWGWREQATSTGSEPEPEQGPNLTQGLFQAWRDLPSQSA
ncbi:carboxy methyl transferase for protein phosphatase 2A [Myotisia sp. PD_48]|nr:carboxy methyl transferase for protein phosphatase 2A [Myotisia sp. PD_48]